MEGIEIGSYTPIDNDNKNSNSIILDNVSKLSDVNENVNFSDILDPKKYILDNAKNFLDDEIYNGLLESKLFSEQILAWSDIINQYLTDYFRLVDNNRKELYNILFYYVLKSGLIKQSVKKVSLTKQLDYNLNFSIAVDSNIFDKFRENFGNLRYIFYRLSDDLIKENKDLFFDLIDKITSGKIDKNEIVQDIISKGMFGERIIQYLRKKLVEGEDIDVNSYMDYFRNLLKGSDSENKDKDNNNPIIGDIKSVIDYFNKNLDQNVIEILNKVEIKNYIYTLEELKILFKDEFFFKLIGQYLIDNHIFFKDFRGKQINKNELIKKLDSLNELEDEYNIREELTDLIRRKFFDYYILMKSFNDKIKNKKTNLDGQTHFELIKIKKLLGIQEHKEDIKKHLKEILFEGIDFKGLKKEEINTIKTKFLDFVYENVEKISSTEFLKIKSLISLIIGYKKKIINKDVLKYYIFYLQQKFIYKNINIIDIVNGILGKDFINMKEIGKNITYESIKKIIESKGLNLNNIIRKFNEFLGDKKLNNRKEFRIKFKEFLSKGNFEEINKLRNILRQDKNLTNFQKEQIINYLFYFLEKIGYDYGKLNYKIDTQNTDVLFQLMESFNLLEKIFNNNKYNFPKEFRNQVIKLLKYKSKLEKEGKLDIKDIEELNRIINSLSFQFGDNQIGLYLLDSIKENLNKISLRNNGIDASKIMQKDLGIDYTEDILQFTDPETYDKIKAEKYLNKGIDNVKDNRVPTFKEHKLENNNGTTIDIHYENISNGYKAILEDHKEKISIEVKGNTIEEFNKNLIESYFSLKGWEVKFKNLSFGTKDKLGIDIHKPLTIQDLNHLDKAFSVYIVDSIENDPELKEYFEDHHKDLLKELVFDPIKGISHFSEEYLFNPIFQKKIREKNLFPEEFITFGIIDLQKLNLIGDQVIVNKRLEEYRDKFANGNYG